LNDILNDDVIVQTSSKENKFISYWRQSKYCFCNNLCNNFFFNWYF
jgi:hypothetical protein